MDSFMVAFVHPGQVDGYFMESLLRLQSTDSQRDEPRMKGHIGLQSGPRIASARNELVANFLRVSDADWLLMVDSDMIFSPAAVDKILEVADRETAPIVGGLCFGGGRSGKVFPTLYRLRPAAPNVGPFEIIEEYPDDALCKVDATGAAFLLMHRDALMRMHDAYKDCNSIWFLEGSEYNGHSFGEDWAFCMRAKSLNLPVHVHTGVKIGHVKPAILDETSYAVYRSQRDEIGDGGLAQRHSWRLEGREAIDPPTYVVVPFKGKIQMTADLVWQLVEQEQTSDIFLVNNGLTPLTKEEIELLGCGSKKVVIIDMPDANIHAMWNEGIRFASEEAKGPFNIAILNNDLRIGQGMMGKLSKALRADDKLMAVCPRYDDRVAYGVQYVQGTFGAKGLAGFCFMVKGEMFSFKEKSPEQPLVLFDEKLSWWYGDDDFCLQVASWGLKNGIVYAASVEHLDGGSVTSGPTDTEDWQKRILKDKKYFMDKWGLVAK